MTPYSAAAGGSFSSRASSRSAAFRDVLGQLERVEPLAQLVDLRLLARRPRRAPPGSPSAAGAGRTRAGPSPSPTGPATGSSSRAPDTSSSRFRIARDRAQPLLDVDELEQPLLLLGLEPQGRGDEVGERARVLDVRRRELQLLGQVRDERRSRARTGSGRCASAPRPRATRRPRPAAARTRRRDTARPRPARSSRMRSMPWTRIRSVPSGTRISLWTIAAVPTA